ncbi:hypothetical protein Tco_0614064 [Tanacetum coccineum]
MTLCICTLKTLVQLITFKLGGTENYKVEFTDVQLALHTRNKSGFITRTCVRSPDNAQFQDQYDRCNDVVLSWLLGYVSHDLYKGQVFSKITKDVWDELEETYNKHDGLHIFNLHHKIYTLIKFGMSLSDYYHECNALWRLMHFLMGLDDVFGFVRSLILTTKPLPDMKSAFSTLSRDGSYRNSHVPSKAVKSGPVAFAARSNEPNDDWGDSAVNGNKSEPKSSTKNPKVSIVDEAATYQNSMQTNNTDIVGLFGSTSSRKDTGDKEYATETSV